MVILFQVNEFCYSNTPITIDYIHDWEISQFVSKFGCPDFTYFTQIFNMCILALTVQLLFEYFLYWPGCLNYSKME